MSKVTEQVTKNTKLIPQDGESAEEFTLRVAKKFQGLSDGGWDALPEDVQEWTNRVNETADKDEKFKAADLLSVETEAKAEEEPEAETEGEETDADAAEEAEAESENEAAEAAAAAKPKAKKEKKVVGKVAKKVNGAEHKEKAAKPAKVEKVAKEKPAKVAKKPAKEKGAGRGRAPMFSDDAKIKLLVKENPHRPSSGLYKFWPKYKNGMTVKEALAAGAKRVNLRCRVEDGHIQITNPR